MHEELSPLTHCSTQNTLSFMSTEAGTGVVGLNTKQVLEMLQTNQECISHCTERKMDTTVKDQRCDQEKDYIMTELKH